jgi:mono/diheme cytochrome c family protein
MSFFLLKSILASALIVSAFGAASSMFSAMGKAEKKVSPLVLKKIHKIFGWLFLMLLIPLLIMGMKHWIQLGDQASLRAVLHAVLAWGLVVTVFLKVTIVKYYKQFLRIAPSLGMLVFSLAFVVFIISAGFYFVMTLNADKTPPEVPEAAGSEIAGNAQNGASLFNALCLSCHHADSEENKIGPGLKNLFKKEKLPYSGRPATVENVKQQLIRPILTMPSFAKMTEQEMADILAFLKTL